MYMSVHVCTCVLKCARACVCVCVCSAVWRSEDFWESVFSFYLGPSNGTELWHVPLPMEAILLAPELWILWPQLPESWEGRCAVCSAPLHSCAHPPQVASPQALDGTAACTEVTILATHHGSLLFSSLVCAVSLNCACSWSEHPEGGCALRDAP